MSKEPDLFTPPPITLTERKLANADYLADYLVERNKIISEQYYGGGEIVDQHSDN